MPSIKDLKKRIGSVKNTQQTTKAMKMVSAAKLRRAQEAIQNHRPYAKRILGLIQEVQPLVQIPDDHPILKKSGEGNTGSEGKRVLLVVVSSDRGLCGGFNGTVIKAAQKWAQANSSEKVKLAFVGKKAYDFFKTRPIPVFNYYQELGGKVTFAKAKKLADSLLASYLAGEFDEIKFIYNEFINAVTQKIIVEDFLPVRASAGPVESTSVVENPARDFIVKPSAEEVLKELLAKNFSIQTFRVLLESQAGEHGARMSAMENATKNAGEMIKKLTLQYNKQRQAGITKELLEIIAGSESQKG